MVALFGVLVSVTCCLIPVATGRPSQVTGMVSPVAGLVSTVTGLISTVTSPVPQVAGLISTVTGLISTVAGLISTVARAVSIRASTVLIAAATPVRLTQHVVPSRLIGQPITTGVRAGQATASRLHQVCRSIDTITDRTPTPEGASNPNYAGAPVTGS